jgi:(1->4)-alpha-D-glucan 1-alpha-D-glucosylmutase
MSGTPPLPPRATYRLQLTRDFTFAQAGELAPYLARLGISHAYLSPILAARSGSTHGYDVVDHTCLAPDLGSLDDFRAMVAAFREHGLGVLVDIVPNHMGIGPDNPRWMEVLRWGSAADNAAFFDIDWHPPQPHLAGKVLLPVLDRPLTDIVAAGEIRLVESDSGLDAAWHEHRWPITPRSLPEHMQAEDIRHHFNDGPPERLGNLLDRQCWYLAEWRKAASEINYRRFFAISDLIAIRIDEAGVFEASHGLILRLVEEGLIDGLRIDHIDGLADPRGYLEKLAAEMQRRGREPYILVEKILAKGETLPESWPVAGSTGYDRACAIDRLFCEASGAEALLRDYHQATGRTTPLAQQIRAAKRHFLETEYAGEVARLAHAIHRLAEARPGLRGCSVQTVEQACRDLIVALPVYRCYIDRHGARPADRWWLDVAFDGAGIEDRALAAFLRTLLGAEDSIQADPDAQSALDAVMLFQQISGPAMAKGLEDTVFYRYVPLLALNEVGGQPEPSGLGLGAFHALCQAKRRSHPDELVAGSTHDTKRGEDARSRLLCLSSASALWTAALTRWRAARTDLPRPGANEEHYLFQSMLGAWPPGLQPDDAAGLEDFAGRLRPALLKAAREAGERTNWLEPDAEYEAALDAGIVALLDPARSPEFLADFAQTAERFGFWGALTSLSATLLRLTVPGVPDIFQGAESWVLSMVDPDNRRPVDFAAAERHLAAPPGERPESWHDGAVKAALIRQVLALRRDRPGLFARGDYQPLEAQGAQADCLIAFSRSGPEGRAVVLAPRFWPRLWPDGAAAPDWGDTTLLFPAGQYRDVLTGAQLVTEGGVLWVGQALVHAPCALLLAE